jgi:transposase
MFVFYRWFIYAVKKGGPGVGKTKRGKGTKIMAIADASGLPIDIDSHLASPHKITLVEKLIGDRTYDSDPLDQQMLEANGLEMIAPHRSNRKKKKTQDGRKLHRYKKRRKIERLFAWTQNFRRYIVRYEYHQLNFEGFLRLSCIIILLRQF